MIDRRTLLLGSASGAAALAAGLSGAQAQGGPTKVGFV